MRKLSDYFHRLTTSVPAGHDYFSGDYHHGHARYVYLPGENGAVFDGSFSYVCRLGDDGYDRAEGTFSHNRKHGDWQFNHRGYHGKKTLSVHYVDGELHGSLEFRFARDGVSAQNASVVTLQISHGTVNGMITGFLKGGELRAYCDDNGYADGMWKLIFKRTVLVEVWNHGVLTDSYEETVGDDAKKTPAQPGLLQALNYVLSEECSPLLTMIPRGSHASSLTVAKYSL